MTSAILLKLPIPKNQITLFEYDEVDRLDKIIDPLGKEETITYDGNGNVVSVTDRKNQTITFDYDALNRVEKKTLPGSIETDFTYDEVGNLLTLSDPESSLTYTYDLADRLLTVATTGSPHQPDVTLSFTYDKNGNRKTLVDPTGTTTYNYDLLDRITDITNPSLQVTSFTYDALSRRSTTGFHNNTNTTFTYDAASQLTDLVHDLSAAPFTTLGYDYDKVGNRTSMDVLRPSLSLTSNLTYVYDDLDRLVQATNPLPSFPDQTFDYDPVGNRLLDDTQTNNAMFNNANRLLENDDFTFTYDDNGNLVTKTAKVGGALTTYTYNAEDEMTRIDLPGGSVAEYTYDALGRRIEKDVDGVITRYVYDGEDILFEYDATNVVQSYYTHGLGIDEPLIMERNSASYTYHTDGLGSTLELVDDAGVIQQQYVYDAFGNIVQQTGSLTNPYTYTGREFDPESGLLYYRARYYDPTIGRFLQEDPIGFNSGDLNFYTYVGNNPLTFIDPSGNIPVLVVTVPTIVFAIKIFRAALLIRQAVQIIAHVLETCDTVVYTTDGADEGSAKAGPHDAAQAEAASSSGGSSGDGEDPDDGGEKPNLGRSGTRNNPDGSEKNSLDQVKQIKSKKARKRTIIDSDAKSEQVDKNVLERLRRGEIGLDEI